MLRILTVFGLLAGGVRSQNLDTGRFFRIFGNRNVESDSSIFSGDFPNVHIYNPDQFFRQDPILFDFFKNLTISGNSTTENMQILGPFGSADIELNQNGRRPFRNFFKNLWGGGFGSNEPTIVTVTGSGRSMYDQNNQWLNPPILQLPRRRLVVRKPQQKRRVLVRNLTPTQLRNLQRLNVPVYEVEPTWLGSV